MFTFASPFHKAFMKDTSNAVVAQLVEHWLPKPRVTGSSPAYRSGLHQVVLCDNVVFLLKSTICCDDIISHS